MRRLVLCATLAVLSMPRGAAAQSLTLTEQEALSRLSERSPRVRAIRAEIDIARAGIPAASRFPNPRFGVTRESVAGITEYMVTVAQPLPLSGRRDLQAQAAEALVVGAEARAGEALRGARADLRLAFAQLSVAQTRERELSAMRDRLADLAGMLAKREAAGDAAGFDRLRAEREVHDVDADLLLAGGERVRAQAAVAALFDEGIDPSRIVAVPSRSGVALPPLDDLVERAAKARGDLTALQKDIEAAQFSARAADRLKIPDPELVAGTKSSTAARGDLGSVIGVQLVLPLFDRGTPEHAMADARRRQAEARAEALRAQIRAEIGGLLAELQARRTASEKYRSSALINADQLARIAQVSYDAGDRSILELLDAYRIAANARLRQAALDGAVRELEIELEFVSGWEIR